MHCKIWKQVCIRVVRDYNFMFDANFSLQQKPCRDSTVIHVKFRVRTYPFNFFFLFVIEIKTT